MVTAGAEGAMSGPERDTAVLSVAEAAARLGLLRSSVRDAVRRGYLQPARLVKGEPRFTAAAIDRYRRRLGLGTTAGAEAGASEQR